MKKILLLIAATGGVIALVGGLTDLALLIPLGGGAMVVALVLLPWLSDGSSTTRDDRRAD